MKEQQQKLPFFVICVFFSQVSGACDLVIARTTTFILSVMNWFEIEDGRTILILLRSKFFEGIYVVGNGMNKGPTYLSFYSSLGQQFTMMC